MSARLKPPVPVRARILDELGLEKSLPAEPGDFRVLCGRGPHTVFLGLGPQPGRLHELFPGLSGAGFLECPALSAQLDGQGEPRGGRLPADLAPVEAGDLPALARSGARLILYSPGPRLFPSFWGPLLAAVQTALYSSAPAPRQGLAWLPGGGGDLLRLELREALEARGFHVRLTGDAGLEDLRGLLAGGECPELFFSVNFSGLDPLGETYHLLLAAGTKVAAWCVDNPLHLVSGLKSRFWTALPLFVTDSWFLDPLRQLGAQDVRHLPLAARNSYLKGPTRPPSPAFADLADRLVFVGRSAFPGKAGFFAGCALPTGPRDNAWAEAQAMLESAPPEGAQRPDFGWWLKRLGITRLWPGAQVRQAGFCAEETGRVWRTLCLTRAQADLGRLTVFGDAGWRELLPEETDLRGPVDYYTALPDIAASAGCCLGLTSPLLPCGLSQRHFDTWAWGGLLLSDATPGLGLFPAELTAETTFHCPGELAARFRALASSATRAADIKAAWRSELARGHTYAHRVTAVLGQLGLEA
ncbi:MAG: glycosyltransferase [Proteobacteria bacterium]|nr:glycosyltransferase [Pseudomonadota bacterium]MBU1595203.1 glycosyltransferase [Pseudomonadota bacterium]